MHIVSERSILNEKKNVMKVLLINPRVSVPRGSIRRLPTPLGLMYLATVLEKNNYQISILDSPCEGYETVVVDNTSEYYGLSDDAFIARIKEETPDFVGITCAFSKQAEEVIRTCRIVKEILPDVITCIGGLHPTWLCEEMLRDNSEIDYIVLTEGEGRLIRLLDAINREISLENIDGLAYRKNGQVAVNSPSMFIEDINSLPLPARHLINMEKYIRIGLFGNPFPNGDRVDQILTSRGCPYRCHFCSTPHYWGTFRQRTAENILAELRELKEIYNVNEIQFRDDNLLVNRDNAVRLFQGMKEFDFSWYSGVMIMRLDEELIKLMAESGCYKITISIESANERVLRELIHKPLKLDRVKPVVDWAHQYGISVHADNIIGYPGETIEELMGTFVFNKEVGVDSASFFLPGAYVGSDLYTLCEERGWLAKHSHKTDLKNPSIQIRKNDPEYIMSNDELVGLVDKKTKEFNEWTRSRNPQKWDEKYRIFLAKHKEEEAKIMGRVV